MYSSSVIPACSAAAAVGVLDDRPTHVQAAGSLARGRHRLLQQAAALGVELGARVDVLGRADRQPRLLVLDRVALDRRQLAEELERCLERPVEVDAEAVGAPVDLRQVVGAAAGDRAGDLGYERTSERGRPHGDLPAGLHVEAAVDHQLGELSDRVDPPRAAS